MAGASGNSAGVLHVVATPIGNAEDISARAIRVLSEVDLIACEDTRRTGRLLAAHSIRTPTISYFEHNEYRRIPELVARLRSGENVALVTDAGTPTISDPGYRLVRAAIDAGIHVTAVPGPSAVIAALAVAGLPTDRFAFEGFLPSKPGERERVLAQLAMEERTLVIYEAARRLPRLLSELTAAFGPERHLAVVREATKTHEEILRGSLAELTESFVTREALGEVTLVIEGVYDSRTTIASLQIDESLVVEVLREAGLSLKDAAAAASRITGASRREIYQNAIRKEIRDRNRGRTGAHNKADGLTQVGEKMKFGAFLWQRRGEDLAANARLAEELGFESVWMGEHLGFPTEFKSTYPYDESGKPPVRNDTAIHDPLIVFAYLAAVTSKIKFGTGVYILPLRNPFAVAKAIASLDQLSNGRFLFGVGIGWLKEEFEWVGMEWDNRARRNNETLKLMEALFTEEVPRFKGKTVRTEDFYFNPKTVQQPHPPYIIGGNTDAAIKRACRLGDGWYGIAKTLDKAVELVKHVREIEKGYNRAKPLELTMGVQWRGTMVDDVRRLEEAGVERVLPSGLVARDSLDALRRVHETLVSKFQ